MKLPAWRSRDRLYRLKEIAAAIATGGLLTYLILSESALGRFGYHYTDGQGSALHKVHPAAFLIILSFVLMTAANCKSGCRAESKPVRQASWALLSLTVFSALCAALRSGPQGLGFLLDTHIVVPMIPLVLLEAPRSCARRAIILLMGFAAFDALAGISQAILTRGSGSSEVWGLMGSPLASAMFLPVALFAAFELEAPRTLKAGLLLVAWTAIAVLGNMAALLVTGLGLLSLGSGLVRRFRTAVPPPVLLACGLIVLLGFVRHFHHDVPGLIEMQRQAFRVLEHLRSREAMFGVSEARITELASKEAIHIPQSDINDPWVLMVLTLGGGLFVLWLGATAWFLRTLTRRSAFLVWAVTAYLLVATTSNSFGRKDVVYPAMIGLITCFARVGAYDYKVALRPPVAVTEPG